MKYSLYYAGINNYPAAGILDITFKLYDLAGKVYWIENDTSSNGVISGNYATEYFYDAMLRPSAKIDRDSVETDYLPDGMGNVTNRSMPATGLQWQATYNNAGQMLQEKYVNGSVATRTNTYAYYSSGSALAGLLQTKTDGRGTSCAYSYDDWLRPTNMVYSGALPEQNLTAAWRYEPRGFVTNITEQFASTNTGPATSVQRSYDPYGQLTAESVSAGSFSYGTSQSWDAAGRRSSLNFGNTSYGFGWQADGNLVSASDPTGSGAYNFDTAGLLTSRTVGNRFTGIATRDGEGRPLAITTSINSSAVLSESLTWSGDGLLASHTLVRAADFTDSRSYSYAYLSRRLIQEQLNLNGSARWTNTMIYDNGVGGKLGALTQMGQAAGTSNKWNGAADAFSRVNAETNNTLQYAAYGHVNGQSTLSAWLDNQPVPVSGIGTNAMQWRAMMELNPGAHQLKVAAAHPSGFYTAWATNSFTNNIAYQTTADTFDGAGNVTQRIWKNPNGTTNRTQTLSWDARGRLHAVVERDASNSGYNWSAVYDPLNRRLSTTTVLFSNGVASTGPPQAINSYFDPQVEFLELGVAYGNQTVWKLYGPDANGKYGGLNGTGGFEGVSPGLNLFYPTISDTRGNILAEVTNGVVSWNPSRPTGYGAVPDYRPVALANGADLVQSSAWRGRWVDITGYYQIGLRPYNPISGGWLTYDPVWNERDPNCYTFAGGDPINYFDPDGRLGKNYIEDQAATDVGVANGLTDWTLNLAPLIGTASLTIQGNGVLATTFGPDIYLITGLAHDWTDNMFDRVSTQFGANQANYYGVGYFAGNFLPNLIPIGGEEAAGGSLLGKFTSFMEEKFPVLGTDVGKWLDGLFGIDPLPPVSSPTTVTPSGTILGPQGENQFVLYSDLGSQSSASVIRNGEFVNRLFDSSYPAEGVSGPFGSSLLRGA